MAHSPQPRRLTYVAGAIVLAVLLLLLAGAPLLRVIGPRLAPEALFFVPTNRPAVALTIDDGPSAETTGRVLDVLARHDARATFFVLGEHIQENEGVIERMRREGHEIGNHGLEELPSITLSEDRLRRGLGTTHDRLTAFTPVRWYRPGAGLYRERAVTAAALNGYRIALGDIFPYDTLLLSSTLQIAYIDAWLRPGSVIILHDGRHRGRRLANTLDELIPRIRSRGYDLLTLSELARLETEPGDDPEVRSSESRAYSSTP